MKTFIIFALFCSSLYAAGSTNLALTDKYLVEVFFARGDEPPAKVIRDLVFFYIAERSRGKVLINLVLGGRGESSPDPEALNKAAECRKIIKTVDEPKQLPVFTNQIVTVRCIDGDAIIIKRFPIDAVPIEVRQILTIMGFDDEDFRRLKFIQKQLTNAPMANAPSVLTNK